MSEVDAYTAAGVNVELGNEVSEMMYEAAKATWVNREGRYGTVEASNDSFSAVRFLPLSYLRDTRPLVISNNSDGVGTKIEVAERLRDHSSIAFDLLAMVCDDAAVQGVEPISINTVLEVNSFGSDEDSEERTRQYVRQLARGAIAAAATADVIILNGESAEMGDRISGYGDFNYSWSATAHWAGARNRVVDGTAIKAGDSLVGIQEFGFRSNGLTLARKVLEHAYGPEWHDAKPLDDSTTLGQAVRTPSTIYSRALVEMSGGYAYSHEPRAPFHGAAHITGGGIPEKVGRMLKPTGLGATIFDPFEPYPIALHVQGITLAEGYPVENGRVTDKVGYKKFNMGTGLVIATDKPEDAMQVLREHGHVGKVIGEVTADPYIEVRSKGLEKPGANLLYPLGT